MIESLIQANPNDKELHIKYATAYMKALF